MNKHEPIPLAKSLMDKFAVLTGLSPVGNLPPRRYLWTDAFAVCNFLGLARLTHNKNYTHLIRQGNDLLTQVFNHLKVLILTQSLNVYMVY